MPSSPSRPAELQRLGARPFAHRGLHGPGRPENSRAAFEAAIAAGSGIELAGRQDWLAVGGVEAALHGYEGPVGIMSFNPEAGAWFARHAPERLRGLVVTENGKKGLRGRVELRLSFWRAQADFLACDIRDLPSAFAAGKRAAGTPVYTWTVRTAADRARAAAAADQIVYENLPGG